MRYDKVQSILGLPNYIEIDPVSFDIVCSATSIVASGIHDFDGSVIINPGAYFYRIEAIDSVTERGVNLVSGSDISNVWSYASSESVSTIYPMTNDTINMTVSVLNGSSSTITTVAQTIHFVVYQYTLA